MFAQGHLFFDVCAACAQPLDTRSGGAAVEKKRLFLQKTGAVGLIEGWSHKRFTSSV